MLRGWVGEKVKEGACFNVLYAAAAAAVGRGGRARKDFLLFSCRLD